ncbi:hypothetical protein [Anaeromyxobacter oryzisoli]|uniref:hypothetical protein n=1 Tax=Anaeromyxobacter oryzisoli TaxID=2925408 RepID=UPI001F581B1C|nr:hypothetical protein [Anaeromyxobacter sp. SG63]
MPVSDDSFYEFLATGALYGITVGSTTDAVSARLGPPPETSKLRRVIIWAYGHRLLQVTLKRDRVVLIGVYPRYAKGTGGNVIDGSFPLPLDLNLEALRTRLRERAVPVVDSSRWPGALEIGAGHILAVFDEDGTLESLQI